MLGMVLRSEQFLCLTASCFNDSPYDYASDQNSKLARIKNRCVWHYLNGQDLCFQWVLYDRSFQRRHELRRCKSSAVNLER